MSKLWIHKPGLVEAGSVTVSRVTLWLCELLTLLQDHRLHISPLMVIWVWPSANVLSVSYEPQGSLLVKVHPCHCFNEIAEKMELGQIWYMGVCQGPFLYSGTRNQSDSLKLKQPPWIEDTCWRLIGCLIVLEKLQQEIVHIFRLSDLQSAKLLVSLWCDDSLRKPVGEESCMPTQMHRQAHTHCVNPTLSQTHVHRLHPPPCGGWMSRVVRRMTHFYCSPAMEAPTGCEWSIWTTHSEY